MESLQKISERYTKALSELSDIEGLPQEVIDDTMSGIEGEFNEKAIGVSNYINGLSSDIEAIDNEIKRLQARKNTIKNKADNFRNYLLFNMQKSGINKIECPYFTISTVKGRESVVVDDVDQLPDDCVNTKLTVTADKKAIKDKIKSGEDIQGARIERGEDTLRIK